jgi:tellurite resistance protein
MPVTELSTARLGEALERLRHLQPFQKPRVLKACVEAAAADGTFRLAEAELVRAVAATLDCPLPPVIGALDPATLAA